jgi:2-keto-4-pentenoate hydratase/2-oxohepta-3-ene-1,7-dioic acid hydratase in catechol pathway
MQTQSSKILIQNIWCVGRNYSLHAKELNNPIPERPMFFLKSGACVVFPWEKIKLPSWSKNIHFESELALKFDQNLELSHYTYALDLTARDIQAQAKAKGHPWTLAKSFSQSCPIGDFFEYHEEVKFFESCLNGKRVQTGKIADMIFPIGVLKKFVLEHFPVQPGDLLLTGTPAGVGKIDGGDEINITDNLNHSCEFSF